MFLFVSPTPQSSVFRWDLFGVIGCPKCEDVNLFRKQQAIYNFAFFGLLQDVWSFICLWCFRNPLKPSFCLSMQRVLKWKGEAPVSKISCLIALFLGTLTNTEMPDETHLGRWNFFKCQDFPSISVWDCPPILPRDATVYLILCEECIGQNPQIITQDWHKHWTLMLDNGRRVVTIDP